MLREQNPSCVSALTETIARLFFTSDQVTQVPRRMTIDSFKCKKYLNPRDLTGSQCKQHSTAKLCDCNEYYISYKLLRAISAKSEKSIIGVVNHNSVVHTHPSILQTDI